MYGVARNEAADILCQVDAYPPPESFKWSFNNTAETFDMPQSGYRLHSDQASTLTYTPIKVCPKKFRLVRSMSHSNMTSGFRFFVGVVTFIYDQKLYLPTLIVNNVAHTPLPQNELHFKNTLSVQHFQHKCSLC